MSVAQEVHLIRSHRNYICNQDIIEAVQEHPDRYPAINRIITGRDRKAARALLTRAIKDSDEFIRSNSNGGKKTIGALWRIK